MPVTFFPVTGDVLTQVACSCGDVKAPTLFVSHREAYKAVYETCEVARPTCDDEYCNAYPSVSFVPVDSIPEVNVSNRNAEEILDILGYQVGETFSERCAGTVTADDFIGRVMVASGLMLSDPGVPVTQQGQIVSCGRSEGYLNERFEELLTVAEYAVANGFDITWS